MASIRTTWHRIKGTTWLVVAALTFVFTTLFHLLAAQALSSQVERPVAFWLRSLVTGPGLSPRMKIFAIDDPTVSAMQRFEPTLEEWGKIFIALERAGAAVIMVDKIFDQFYRDEDVATLDSYMKDLKIPVMTVAFTSLKPIPLRNEITDVAKFGVKEDVLAEVHGEILSVPGKLYGPNPKIEPLMSGLGHGMYHGDGLVAPFLDIDGRFIVPHFALAAVSALNANPTLSDVVAGMPRLNDGKILLNFERAETYRKHAISFWPLLSRARDGRPIDVVKPGDIVLLIPGAYSGGTDFYATPVGILPGGYVVATFLSSVLEGRWIRVLPIELLLALVFGMLASWLGMRLRPRLLLALVGGTTVAWALIFGLSFAYGSVLLPLVTPALALIFGGTVASAESARRRQLENVRMTAELNTARAVQSTLIPAADIELPGLKVYSYFRPATECAGDCFSVASATEDRHYLAVGDAVGHGVGPAMISAMVHGGMMNLARAMRRGETPPLSAQQVLASLNDTLVTLGRNESLMTACVIVIDVKAGTLELANGGQPFPTLLNGGVARHLHGGGNPLGFEWTRTFEGHHLDFPTGARLIAFSDGTYECKGTSGRAIGRTAWLKRLKKLADLDGPKLRAQLVEDLERHLGPTPLDDDITLVVIERVR